ncbi:MAG: hypothetical protein AAGA30_17555, partial [Planctomycetota bacterium]
MDESLTTEDAMGRSLLVLMAVGGLFVVGVFGVIFLLFGSVLFMFNELSTPADQFLAAVASKNTEQAKSMLTIGFVNSLDDEEFDELVISNQLDKYESAYWTSTSIQNDAGTLEGAITLFTGATVPLKMELVYEQGAWKINDVARTDGKEFESDVNESPSELSSEIARVEKPESDDGDEDFGSNTEPGNQESAEPWLADDSLTTDREVASDTKDEVAEPVLSNDISQDGGGIDALVLPDEVPVYEGDLAPADASIGLESAQPKTSINVVTVNDIPNKSEAEKMVGRWTNAFAVSLSKNDFSEFYERTSIQFQRRIPMAKLGEVFQDPNSKQNNLDFVRKARPRLKSAPTVNGRGVLEIRGRFASRPPLNFQYEFVRENDEWLPSGMDLEIHTSSTRVIPPMEDIKELAKINTAAFGRAVGRKDFTNFYSNLAYGFRQKYGLAQFTRIFRSFIEQGADLEWIGDVEPEFTVAPSLNTDGVLE